VTPTDADVVVVGGGIAGGALALRLARAGMRVVLLERQKEHRDFVRGEMLAPWGVAEAENMGVTDAIYRADPAPLRSWVQWDEVYDDPSDAPRIDLTRTLVPGVDSPLTIFHHQTCRRLVEAAGEAGADVHMGVTGVEVTAGASPGVAFAVGEGARPSQLSCRLVVGAGGRAGPVGRQIGVSFEKRSHHWGGGLAVEGLDEWPACGNT
jgi:2-polyprenyl-6-methoxyphenol hydroxylase-like FAD-dependent oxidoreductase